MKISDNLSVHLHWGLLRGLRDRALRRFGHAAPAQAPVAHKTSAWQRARWLEFVTRDEVAQRLCDAARQGDEPRVRHLLKHPLSDPNAAVDGSTATRLAVDHGHVATLKVLLADRRTDPNLGDSTAASPLHAAATQGNVDAIQVLLGDEGTQVDAADIDGMSPLLRAVEANQAEAVKKIGLRATVDLHRANDEGLTPGGLAARRKLKESLVALRDTPYFDARRCPPGSESAMSMALLLDHEDVVADLLEGPMEFFVLSEDMVLAARRGAAKSMKVLLAHDGDPNRPDAQGCTPLKSAIQARSAPVVEALRSSPLLDLTLADQDGVTPLMAAIVEGDEAVLQALLGPPPQDHENVVADPLADAADRRLAITPDDMVFAARHGAAQSMKVLLAHGGDPNQPDAQGCTPLKAAIQARSAPVVEVLQSSPQLDLNHADQDGVTPLMAAIVEGDEAVLQALLTSDDTLPNVIVNQAMPDGVTPLMVAAHHSAVALRLLLAQPGIQPEQQDMGGCTALIHAIVAGKADAVAILLADPRVDLREAVTMARQAGAEEIMVAVSACQQDLVTLDALDATSSVQPDILLQHLESEADPAARQRMFVSYLRWQAMRHRAGDARPDCAEPWNHHADRATQHEQLPTRQLLEAQ